MDETRIDKAMKFLAQTAGRRDALRSLGAVGMAVLAGLGLFGATEPALAGKRAKRKKRKNRRRTKRAQRALDRACQAIGGETCAGCEETCDATCGDCSFCYHQSDGPPLCASAASWAGCPECTSESDCAPGLHCVKGQTFASSGTTERLGGLCEYSVGLCINIFSCI
jgi:hypothetical protein